MWKLRIIDNMLFQYLHQFLDLLTKVEEFQGFLVLQLQIMDKYKKKIKLENIIKFIWLFKFYLKNLKFWNAIKKLMI